MQVIVARVNNNRPEQPPSGLGGGEEEALRCTSCQSIPDPVAQAHAQAGRRFIDILYKFLRWVNNPVLWAGWAQSPPRRHGHGCLFALMRFECASLLTGLHSPLLDGPVRGGCTSLSLSETVSVGYSRNYSKSISMVTFFLTWSCVSAW